MTVPRVRPLLSLTCAMAMAVAPPQAPVDDCVMHDREAHWAGRARNRQKRYVQDDFPEGSFPG